jgi:nucleoside-diphosphate-sugar epimerase
MKLAVTGISGYLGQVLFRRLEKDKTIKKIIGIDVKEPPAGKKVKFIHRDIRDEGIKSDLKGCDALVHLAFVVMPVRKSDAVIDAINVDGSKNVFRAAAEVGIKKIIYTSSVASYGSWPDNPVPIKEDWPRRPQKDFYYARTKAAVENWLDEFEKKHPDLAIIRLRPHIFVGPTIDNLANESFSQKIMVAIMGSKQYLQLVWDGDVVDAICLSLKKDVRGAFNIAPDDWLDIHEVAAILGKPVIPIPYVLAYLAAKAAWTLRLSKFFHPAWLNGFRYPIVADNSKAKKQLGWKPTRTTRELVKQLPEMIK